MSEQPTVAINDCEVYPGSDYTIAEREFMQAMDQYKRRNQRPFPTCREVLAVAHALGYRKVAEPTELPRTVRGRNQEVKTPKGYAGRDRRKLPRPVAPEGGRE